MIKTLFKQIPTYIFIFCIADIIIYQTILVRVPEAFPAAYELGDIQYRICFAFVTSFLFYLLITFLPKEKDKKNVYEYVNVKKEKLFHHIDLFFGVMVEKANRYETNDPKRKMVHSMLFENRFLEIENLSLQDFKDVCYLIHTNDPSPISYLENKTFVNYEWKDYLKYEADLVKEYIAEIFILIPHLNTRHIKLLTEINECEFVRICSLGKIFELLDSEPDIEVLHKSIYDFYLTYLKVKSEW